MLQTQKDNIKWEIEPAFASLLDRVLSSSGKIIKESPAKIVTEHRVGEVRFFVKRYRHYAVPFRPVKYFFKKSQAGEEWKLAQELEGRKIPIVRHLALGERWSWRGLEESILVTEGFDGKQLNEAQHVDWQILLQFVNRLHDHGVLQRDLHLANILVNESSKELRLVDLHGIEIKSSLNRNERDSNLAFLRIFAPIPVSAEVNALSRKLRKTALAERARRCLKRNRDFGRKQFGGRDWQVRFPLINPSAEKIMADPETVFSQSRLLKDGRSSSVGNSGGFVLKRYNFRKWTGLVTNFFRSSKARKNFCKAYHLELTGIPTARAVATSDERAPFLLRSYFLMEEIPGATPLHLHRGDDPEIIRNVAGIIAKLHNEGFRHRDLKAGNILVSASREVHLIDHDGLEFVGTVLSKDAEEDFVRLFRGWEFTAEFGKPQRELFLKFYNEFRLKD